MTNPYNPQLVNEWDGVVQSHNLMSEDKVNFLFSANPDQELAPLSKIISGGEMSRFLLALKSSISNVPDTLFFD